LDHSVGLVNGIFATEAAAGSNHGWDLVFRTIDDHIRSPLVLAHISRTLVQR
jgi:hypothetical protein